MRGMLCQSHDTAARWAADCCRLLDFLALTSVCKQGLSTAPKQLHVCGVLTVRSPMFLTVAQACCMGKRVEARFPRLGTCTNSAHDAATEQKAGGSDVNW